jgi:N-acetylglucosamine-6-phosphate deacetylase
MVEGGLPEVAEFEKLINHYKGLVKIVTLAPEIPNGLQLVDTLVKDGIIASIGHSNATFEEAEEAIRHGVTRSSHTYNGMSGLNHRKPGAVGAVMDSDVVYAEITLDGFHVHPGAAQALFRAKGIDRIILITDSMQAAGLGDGEFVRPGNRKIIVKDGKATLLTGNLAGSVLTLNKAVRNARNFLHISLSQALQMASANVAKSIGAQNLGEIKEGSTADLIIHDEDMNVLFTMIDGRNIFSKLGSEQINGH